MYCSPISKTNLQLTRVHIHIDLPRIHLKVKHVGWLAAVIHQVAIRLFDCMGNCLVSHHAAIHIEILHISLTARKRRLCDPATERQRFRWPLKVQCMPQKFTTKYPLHPRLTAFLHLADRLAKFGTCGRITSLRRCQT